MFKLLPLWSNLAYKNAEISIQLYIKAFLLNLQLTNKSKMSTSMNLNHFMLELIQHLSHKNYILCKVIEVLYFKLITCKKVNVSIETLDLVFELLLVKKQFTIFM